MNNNFFIKNWRLILLSLVIIVFFISLVKTHNKNIVENNKQSEEPKNIIEQEKINQNILKFNNRDLWLVEKEEINNGVAFYFRDDVTSENSRSELIINAYDEEINAEELAKNVKDNLEKRNNKLYSSFTAPDKNNRDAFYITSLAIYYPEEPYADIYLMKIFSADRTYMIIYRESLPGVGEVGLELIADSWLSDNLESYSNEIEKIDPYEFLVSQNIVNSTSTNNLSDEMRNNFYGDISNLTYNQVLNSKIEPERSPTLHDSKLDGNIIEWKAKISSYYSQITGIKFCVIDDDHKNIDIDKPCDWFWAFNEVLMDANNIEVNPIWDGLWVNYILNYYKVPFDKNMRFYNDVYTIKGTVNGIDCGVGNKCVPNIDIISIIKKEE